MRPEVAEFAARLHGRQYRHELTRAESDEAKALDLVVAYGASDDLTEFAGRVRDEAGAWNGGEHAISEDWEVIPERDDADELKRAGWTPPKPLFHVIAQWCPEGFAGSWLITSDAPFAEFDIMEDDELYCRGCVIDARAALAKCGPPHEHDTEVKS